MMTWDMKKLCHFQVMSCPCWPGAKKHVNYFPEYQTLRFYIQSPRTLETDVRQYNTREEPNLILFKCADGNSGGVSCA